MDGQLLNELVYALVLLAWIVVLVTVITKKTYEWMKHRGLSHNVAIYYIGRLSTLPPEGSSPYSYPSSSPAPCYPSGWRFS